MKIVLTIVAGAFGIYGGRIAHYNGVWKIFLSKTNCELWSLKTKEEAALDAGREGRIHDILWLAGRGSHWYGTERVTANARRVLEMQRFLDVFFGHDLPTSSVNQTG